MELQAKIKYSFIIQPDVYDITARLKEEVFSRYKQSQIKNRIIEQKVKAGSEMNEVVLRVYRLKYIGYLFIQSLLIKL